MRAQLLIGAFVIFGAGFAACSSDSSSGGAGVGGSATQDGSFGSGGTGGSFNGGAGTGTSGGSTATGGTSGGAGAYPGAGGTSDPPRVPGPGADAAADAASDSGETSACAALDDTKDAVFYLSSDDSNSMASPVIARNMIQRGWQVPPGIVRTYEFLNYYNIGFPDAAAGTLDIVAELRNATEADSLELGIGIVAPAAPNPRRPINVTFVLDTSGSMTGQPIALQRAAVIAIAGELQKGDLVSVVTWNTSNAVLLDSHAVAGPWDPTLVSLANYKLDAAGGTDLHGGLSKGYAIATKNFDKARLNRVVLISDGLANVGITQEDLIGQGAQLNDGDGIYLVGIGVGEGVNDTLMNTVTDAGRGAYIYLDSADEAKRMLGDRFDEVMELAARGVQVELRLPWYMGIAKFYGEEYSTNPQEIEPQHLAPDDAMFFDQLVKPCSPSVYSADDPIEIVARWQVPVTHQPLSVSKTTTLASLLGQQPKYLPKAAAIIAYAEALKATSDAEPKLVVAKARIKEADPSAVDPELNEISALIDLALAIY